MRQSGQRSIQGSVFVEMLIAVTRPVSPSLAECELTHLSRVSIDVPRAVEQHASYVELLRSLGATIIPVAAAPELPDAVFIEDTALVLDEVAVMTRPGAEVRRRELTAVAPVLKEYRRVLSLEDPATLDGGDVLRVGRKLYVGRSSRTNQHGIEQLQRLLYVYEYRVIPVDFAGCLHLKSAVTEVADAVLLLNPDWVSADAFPDSDAIEVDDAEPYGANALRIGDDVVYGSQFPRTHERLTQRGLSVSSIDLSELAKAEGAVTCCSLLFKEESPLFGFTRDYSTPARPSF
jgi:dimethylargininase